ncbi:hypothetical protein PoB_001558900 [Plakobranchus ocellatus]|uniref:Uncharacterized protein n=1 Tax=Plakobranchus ocellatus TaxID=259542 RepID=A0AAV3Z197_9GAST|nr:hypothetical protein PoB_001558900 [Plakobranchus ocellatus]
MITPGSACISEDGKSPAEDAQRVDSPRILPSILVSPTRVSSSSHGEESEIDLDSVVSGSILSIQFSPPTDASSTATT